MEEALIQSVSKATGASAAIIKSALGRPRERSHGDLTLQCFQLAKDAGTNPAQFAKDLAAKISLPTEVESVSPVGPYLNFRYKRDWYVSQTVSKLFQAGEAVGKLPSNEKTILIDYSHPNIAKTFHVGHLRTTLIGHSLVQILRHLGYRVNGINHLGDWGTQFGFVWAGCELWGKPENASVDDLVDVYRRATALRKQQDEGTVPAEDKDKPDVNQMARDYFIRLEKGDSDARAFWQWCLDVSLVYFKAMYQRLGIEFEYYTGESFYEKMLPDVEQRVRDSGILEDSEGALGVDLGKKLGFARVFAPDGRSLYITRDIAAAFYRWETFSPYQILYVVSAQQSLHFKQLIEILKRMKHPVAERMVHVAFGFLPGMKTREGGGISLKQFLDEAGDRAKEAYQTEVSRRPEGTNEAEVAEAVAIGATYFYFLSHTNIKDFQFSWEKALNFSGDSGPYLQYAYARINGIEAKANQAGVKSGDLTNLSLLTEQSAYELVSVLSEFEEVVAKSAAEFEPYYIAYYLLDLAKAFSKAYLDLKVVDAEPKVAAARLSLFLATRNVLGTGLRLIGVPRITRM